MKLSLIKIRWFIILILLLVGVTPFASSLPDGLELVAEKFGFETLAEKFIFWQNAPFLNYKLGTLSESPIVTVFVGFIGVMLAVSAPILFLKLQIAKWKK